MSENIKLENIKLVSKKIGGHATESMFLTYTIIEDGYSLGIKHEHIFNQSVENEIIELNQIIENGKNLTGRRAAPAKASINRLNALKILTSGVN